MLVGALPTMLAIDKKSLTFKVCCFASDGASVNLDCHNGIAARLQAELAPVMESLHCMAHCSQV